MKILIIEYWVLLVLLVTMVNGQAGGSKVEIWNILNVRYTLEQINAF